MELELCCQHEASLRWAYNVQDCQAAVRAVQLADNLLFKHQGTRRGANNCSFKGIKSTQLPSILSTGGGGSDKRGVYKHRLTRICS